MRYKYPHLQRIWGFGGIYLFQEEKGILTMDKQKLFYSPRQALVSERADGTSHLLLPLFPYQYLI